MNGTKSQHTPQPFIPNMAITKHLAQVNFVQNVAKIVLLGWLRFAIIIELSQN